MIFILFDGISGLIKHQHTFETERFFKSEKIIKNASVSKYISECSSRVDFIIKEKEVLIKKTKEIKMSFIINFTMSVIV